MEVNLESLKAIALLLTMITILTKQINIMQYIKPPDTQEPPLIEMEATAYYEGTICYDGSPPKVLQTCGAAKEYIGCTFIVFESVDGQAGDYLFTLYCNDTGSDYRIKNGTVIDIFMSTYKECITWGRQKVFVQIIREVEEDG